jgi:hypothetical protein
MPSSSFFATMRTAMTMPHSLRLEGQQHMGVISEITEEYFFPTIDSLVSLLYILFTECRLLMQFKNY